MSALSNAAAAKAGPHRKASVGRQAVVTRSWWALVALGVIFIPYALSDQGIAVMSIVPAYALVVLGLVLIQGQGGQLSLGQSGFMALGAFSSAALTTKYGWSPVLALLVGIVLAVAVAFILGVATLRLRGLYFAVSTFGFATIIGSLALGLHGLTGGPSGQIVGSFSVPGFDFGAPYSQYLLNWALLGAACVVIYNLLRSPKGRALRAIGRDPLMASGLGVPVVRYKVIVFMVSAGLAAIGGSMYAHTTSFISAESVGPNLALSFVAMYFLGGANSLTGAVVGTGLLVWIPQLFPSTLKYQLFIAGGLLLIVLRFIPGGVVPGVLGLVRKRLGAPSAVADGELSVDDAAPTTAADRDEPAAVAGLPLRVAGVAKAFGGLRVLTDCSFEVPPGKITSIIGPNGAGKTTLLNIISNVVAPDSGSVHVGDTDITGVAAHQVAGLCVARTYQTPRLFATASVLDNVVVGAFRLSRVSWWAAALRLPSFRSAERQLHAQAMGALRAVGLADYASAPAGSLPLGHQRLLEIARALVSVPRIVALDEPAAGSNDSERRFLAALVKAMSQAGITVLLIEHNMDMVMTISNEVVVLDQGQIIASGPPAVVKAQAQVIEAYLGSVPEELVTTESRDNSHA